MAANKNEPRNGPATLDSEEPPQPLHHWTLTDVEVAALLRENNVEPWLGSPLAERDWTGIVAAPPQGKTAEAGPALAHVAQPRMIVGLVRYPPGPPEFEWYYGGDGDGHLAGHRLEEATHHVAWPVSQRTLVERVETPLALAQPAGVEGLQLSLDRYGLAALVAVVDVLQETGLLAMLSRQQAPETSFDTLDLLQCYERSVIGDDPRWMATRAGTMVPVLLDPTPDSMHAGLGQLVQQGMLTDDGGTYRPTQPFGQGCAAMSGGEAFAALATRRWDAAAGQGQWRLDHTAVFRGTASLWMMAFSEITESDFKVTFCDATAETVDAAVRQALTPPATQPSAQVPSVGTPTPSAPSAVAPSACSSCGAELRPDARFCTQCGAAVK